MGKKEQNIALSMVILTSTLLLVWYWLWGRFKYPISLGDPCIIDLMLWSGLASLLLLPPLLRLTRSSIRPEVSEKEKKNLLWFFGTLLYLLNGVGIWVFLILINGAFDQNPGIPHEVKVIGKKEFEGTRTQSFNLFVESWKSPSERVRIQLTVEDYDRLEVKKGDTVIVETGEGALGCEWIRGVSEKPAGGKV